MKRVQEALAPPRDLTWLLHTTNQMVGCRSMDTLLDLAYNAVRDGLGYDRVGLMLVDAARQVIACHIGTDEDGCKTYLDQRDIPLDGDDFYTRLLADPHMQVGGQGFVYLASSSLTTTFEDRVYIDGRPAQNLLVSLRTADKVLGYMSVDNLTSGRPITTADAPALVAFANALAVTMENVMLLESRAHRIDDLDAGLRQRVEYLTWLQEASVGLATMLDLECVLDAIYESVQIGLRYDRVGLFLLESSQGRRVMREVRGTDRYGRPTRHQPYTCPVDDPAAPAHSPDVYHLLQGNSSFFCSNRWAITPPAYRHQLDGHMGEQLAVALRRDGDLIGFISVDNLLSSRPIAPDDAAPLVAFASQAALAISRAQLWAAHEAQSLHLAQRVTELEWLRDMSHRVNAAGSLDALVSVVYDGIITGLAYDRATIWLRNDAGTALEEQPGVDGSQAPRSLALGEANPAQGIPGVAALLGGEVSYYYSSETPCSWDTLSLFRGPITQPLLVALRAEDAILGVLALDNAYSGRPLSLERCGSLLALAGQVGTAIQNMRLREQERVERARLTVLLESAHALNSTLDSNEILQDLAARLVTALDAACATFRYVDSGDRICILVAQHAVPGRRPFRLENPETTFDLYPMVEQVVRTGLPFHGYAGDPDFPASERSYLQEYDLDAELIVPVAMRGVTIGLLAVYWARGAGITADAIALCTAIAEQVAVALGNARLYADLAERADHDALTGLLNHSAVLERIDSAVADAASFALLLLDVDNFKLFNDTYGHLTGDGVLAWVAGILRATCRDNDAAGRYGGDEMAVVLRGASATEAATVVRRLTEAMRERPHVTASGATIPISVSVGLACFPEDGRSRQELVAVADAAMYAAKRRTGPGTPSAQEGRIPAHVPRVHLRDAADLLGDSPFGVLEGLVAAVDAKDHYTRVHSEHVTHLAVLLVDALGLPAEQRRVLAVAGLLHDVGKIGVPDRILRKPGSLATEEYDAIKRHVPYGVAIIQGVLDDAAVVDAVAYHHERWDGLGYPRAVAGPATPLASRILQIADATSSMLLDRPYRKGLPWHQVVVRLRACAGTQFDPVLVEPFITAVERFQASTLS